MGAILTIAHLTLYEARRRRIVTAAVICAVGFLAVFTTAMFFAGREINRNETNLVVRQAQLALLTVAGLYGTNFLSVLFAVLLPVDALSGEIDSGIMQTLACKPIRRGDILAGKWLGHWVIVCAYVLTLATGVLISGRLTAGYVQLNVVYPLLLMVLEVTLLLTITVAGGTRLSTVTNGIVALGFYGIAFIGGWVEQIGALAGIQSARYIGIAASLVSPADSLWRLGVYLMQPAIVRSLDQTPFASASVPNQLMVWWAVAFTAVTFTIALRQFGRRAL
jgi:ABC-type transport system involved in multi-copper enzyme maturation permease subunit